MTIETPPLKPETIKKIESDFGSTIASFIWKKVLQHQMWVNRSLPVGSILTFFGSQLKARTGVSNELIDQPDGDFWQWCDGSAIANANSPLLGQNTPNFKEKFLKGSTTIGLTGGQTTINLQHNHSGYTDYQTDKSVHLVADAGLDYNNGDFHRHTIASQWPSSEPIIPPYIEMQYYLRIDGGPGSSTPHLDYLLNTSFGDLINESMVQYGKILSEELATSIYYNALLLDALIPVGSVVPIMTNIPGVPSVDTNIFQECDGSEILNVNSPLRSVGGEQRYVPNLIEHYIRVPLTFGLSGTRGGVNDSVNFWHGHTGGTGVHINPADVDAGGNQYMAEQYHSHGIPDSFDVPFNIEPPFFTVRYFMRIQ